VERAAHFRGDLVNDGEQAHALVDQCQALFAGMRQFFRVAHERLTYHNELHITHQYGDQMTQRRWLSPIVMAAGLLLLVSGPCMAQLSPFGWDPNTALLTDEDWRLVWEGTVSLNRTPDAAAGETRAWSDAASGNSGKVTLTRVFESNGATCHALRYAIAFSEKPMPQEYNFNWCRTSAGQWKIAS
jgi:hypothetical protein